MIKKEEIESIVSAFIKDTEMFVVDIKVSASNVIRVTIDAMSGVDIDTCIDLSRNIETHFDREIEDFELEVSSASISEPFQVFRQYEKNIGREVCVQKLDNEKLTGILTDVQQDFIHLEYEAMMKVGAKGKKKKVSQEADIPFSEIRQTTLVISLKK